MTTTFATPSPPTGRRQAPGTDHLLASFPARAWAHVLSALVLQIIMWLAAIPSWLFGRAAAVSSATCTVQDGSTVCTTSELVTYVAAGVAALVVILATHITYIRPLTLRSGTIGMRQMGIRMYGQPAFGSAYRGGARSTDGSFTVGSAWLWVTISQPGIVVALLTPAIIAVATTEFDNSAALSGIITALIVAAIALTFANMVTAFFTDRRQTLADLATKRFPVEEYRPSWMAVASCISGYAIATWVLVVAWLAVSGTIGAQGVLDELTGTRWTRGPIIPIVVVCLVGAATSVLALRETRWSESRRAGRGLALIGTLMSLTAPGMSLLGVGAYQVGTTIDSLNQRTCSEVRADVEMAAESFRSLNGFYPPSISQISGPPYLIEEVDPDRWTYSAGPAGASFVLTGAGDCNGG